LLDDQNVAVEA